METVNVLGLTLYPYGLCAAAAFALFLGLAALGKKVKADLLSWLAPLSLVLGLLGARAGFCLAAWDWAAQEGPGFFFDFTRGGYMFYGALVGQIAALWLACRICRTPMAPAADALAAPYMVMLALCRLGEGLVGQGYGWAVEDWFMADSGMSLFVWEDPSFLYRFPFSVPDFYGTYNWAVFVLEALAALGIALILLRIKNRRAGGRAVMMVLLYAVSQVLMESLRQDSVLRWGFVRVNQVIAAVLVLALLLVCWRKSPRPRAKGLAGSLAVMLLGMGLVMAMEFALEKKISAIEFVPMDVCYLVMALGCVLLAGCILPHWKRAFPSHD